KKSITKDLNMQYSAPIMEELYNNKLQEDTDQRSCTNSSDTNLDFNKCKKNLLLELLYKANECRY
ncbi:MAG TPA: hypothetical protein VFT71_08520, partial [Candidatus Nitrosocosmicus sp.]|nr:hypothetical protein [Candidatus Nitrosocosmicus sp.]